MGILRHGIQAHGVIPITAVSSSSASYRERVMLTNPIRYWPLWEPSGTVATELIAADNGTYARDVATMTTGAGIGDGHTAPLFDGTNDFVNIYSAALNTAFSGAAGSVLIWARVSAAGVWTDGTARTLLGIRADGNNYIRLNKATTNNQLEWFYVANGTVESNTSVALSGTLSTFSVGMTWDANAGANGEVVYYLNGASGGATDTDLGAWAWALSASECLIGAPATVGGLRWSGYIGPVGIWASALTPTQMASVGAI